MAANKAVRFGPVTVANSVGNVFNPPTLTGGVNPPAGSNTYFIIKHLRVINRTGAPVNMSAFVGLTGVGTAGTEFAWSATPVPANGYLDWYGNPGKRLDVADFLTAVAGSASALTLEGEGEIGVA